MRPMLAQSGDRDQLPAYIEDDSYVLEQKLDGQRLVVRVQNEQGQPLKVEAFNRAGMPKQTMVNKTLLTCFEFFASEGTWSGRPTTSSICQKAETVWSRSPPR